jgi:hypothetical protein
MKRMAARGGSLASHRDGRGCIARRMQPDLHHGLLALLLAAAGLSALPLVGLAQKEPEATYERPVVTVGPGPQRLAIDSGLLAAGAPFRVLRRGERSYAEDGLTDLRLVTEGGRPVPHLLIQPPAPEREWIRGSILGVAATKKASGFEVDLGAAQAVDMVRVEGLPVPHLKRLTLEGSGDRARWTTLVAEGTLFDLPDEQLRQNTLGFAPGPYRYLRVTWNDTNSGRVPNPSEVVARRVSTAPPPPPTTLVASIERRPSEPGISRFRVRLPAARLPIVALDLDVGPGASSGHVYRRAVVTESRFAGFEAAPVELGGAMLSRVVRDGLTASALKVPIAPPSEAEIELTIDDGANEPLDLRAVSVVLAELPWIYFEAPAGAVTARYGNLTLPRPAYDLEAVRGSVDLGRLPEAKWGDGGSVRITKAAGATASLVPNAGPTLDPAAFKYTRAVEYTLEGGQKGSGLVALPIDAHALADSRGPSVRFADIRLLDSANQQIPYLVERRNEPLSVDLAVKPASNLLSQELKAPPGSRQRSVYVVTLPYANLPPSTLVVDTSARVFQRTVTIGFDRPPDRHRRDPYFEVKVAQTWRHADEQTPARPLAFRIETMPETEILLVVDEGDNAPLPVTTARLLLSSYRLRFYHTGNAGLRLAYGRDDLQPPQYDLALLAPQVMGARAMEVSAAPVLGAAPPAAASFASPRTFWVVLTGAVLVLLALIVKLIRGHGDQAGN